MNPNNDFTDNVILKSQQRLFNNYEQATNGFDKRLCRENLSMFINNSKHFKMIRKNFDYVKDIIIKAKLIDEVHIIIYEQRINKLL